MTLTFYRYGSTDTTDTLELDETKSSIIDKLNEPSRLSAILTSETAPQIALGNYTDYNGTRYYITKEPTVRKEHSQLYTVEVDLERSLGLARITILANPVDHRTTFDYTGTATEHLQLIIDCLNAKYEEVGLKWTRGAIHCKDTIKHIKYDGTTVLGALQQIRETYETDIFAVGETLSLGQEDDKTTALPLAYGKGKGLLSGLERHKHTDDTVPTRLYVTGTKRNMVKGRLTLEKDVVLAIDLKSGTIERHSGGVDIKPDGRTLYRTDKAGQYIAEWSSTDKFFQSGRRFPTEATYTNEEIYPSHVSTIQTVTKVKDHYEVNSDFNYDKFRLEGEQMQVVFQTGNLAGREFDAKYLLGSDRLAIVPKEEDDTTLPNDTLCPKVGDQYIVTGIKLPNQYIREAERNLTDEALRHLIKLQETRYSYKADIDPVYLHDNHNTIAPQLAVGKYVRLTDQQIAIGDPYVRIVGKRTYLDRPYTPEIELSNEVEPRSELTRVLNELDRQDDDILSLLDRLRGINGELTLSSEEIRKRLGTAEETIARNRQDADNSFEELSNHPLAVDKDGFWQIWSVKDGAYKTTEYQSRGRDGEPGAKGADGKDAGRYLGRATRLNTSISRNYRAEESRSWETANEGDYVYLTISDSDWEKGNYYIVRERKDKTVWELYDIKGHTPTINWDGTKLIIDNMAPVDLRGQRGEAGHSPNPDEVLGTDLFRQKLSGEVTEKIAPVKSQLESTTEQAKRAEGKADALTGALNDTADHFFSELNNAKVELQGGIGEAIGKANTSLGEVAHANERMDYISHNVSNLQEVALTSDQRKNLTYLTSSLQVLMSGSGDNATLEGLALQRLIALSGDGTNVSAYIASKPMNTALKAGITNFGTPQEREQVAINHDGTGHVGNLYFTGNQIDFRTGRDDDPYLSIGADVNQFIDNFIDTARLDDTPVAVGSLTLTTSTTSYERTVDVANNGTRLTVYIGDLNVATYKGATTRLLLDGEVLAEWEGVVDIISGSAGGIVIEPQYNEYPYTASDLSYERVVKAGRHAIRLEIVQPNSGATATVQGLRVRRRYDTGAQQSALTKSGLRLFGSPDRYLDVDYRQTYRQDVGMGNYAYLHNPYLLRIKGGAKVDKLTAEELDMPGVPLCGATFNENGGQEKAFGKYVNQQGTSRAQAEYDYSMRAYKVYHSIGNTNYIPMVQVSGWNGGDINWSLTPRVYEVSSYYFVVRILSNNDNPQRKAISYVAYKTM